jgi:hypothetical protein
MPSLPSQQRTTRLWASLYLALGALLALPPVTAAQDTTPDQRMVQRMLDRSAARIRQRNDLSGRVSPGFNSDSLYRRVTIGLARVSDSTVVEWFAELARLFDGIEPAACDSLTAGPPDPRRIVKFISADDSTLIERWFTQWEIATVASYLGEKRTPVSDEEMIATVFSLIGPLSKDQEAREGNTECQKLRSFLRNVLALPDEKRAILFRGIAGQLGGKKTMTKPQ